jgi:hypothetical protein
MLSKLNLSGLPEFTFAGIAQLVEQRTENPRVTSSSLVPGISNRREDQHSEYINALTLVHLHPLICANLVLIAVKLR